MKGFIMRAMTPVLMGVISISILAAHCHASSLSRGRITVSPVFGFNGVIRSGAWTPVSVVLENRGAPVYDGRLEITVTRGDEYRKDMYHNRYTTRVDLPAGSKKIFRFQVFVQSGLHPVMITLYSSGKPVFQKTMPIRRSVTDKNILVIVQKTVSNDFLGTVPDRFTPAVVHARHLPHQWQGYQGVGALILSAQILPRLESSQLTALLQWIESGGTLISSGSMNTSLFSSDAVKKVLQVRVLGVEKMDPISAIPRFCGVADQIIGGLWVNRARMTGADVLISQDDLPLVFSKTVKDGRILFLSFETVGSSFFKWKGNSRFWQTLLSHAPLSVSFPDLPDDDTVLDLLMENSQKIFPEFTTMAALLGLYLACMVWLLKTPAREGKKKIMHLSALGLAIILFGGVQLWLFGERSDDTKRISITRASGNRARMAIDTYTGIYSPHAVNKRFEAGPDPAQVIFPPAQDRRSWLPSAMFFDKGRQYLDLALGRYDLFHYKTRQICDSPFKATLRQSAGAMVLELTNMSGAPIRDSFFYDGTTVFFIGDIPPDSTITQTLKSPVPGFASGAVTEGITGLKNRFAAGSLHDSNLTDEVLAALFSILRSRADQQSAMVLAGIYHPEKANLDSRSGWLVWEVIEPDRAAGEKERTQG